MVRRDARTVPVHELPTVLVVGCTREFVERCREGAASVGAIVRSADPADAELMAKTCRPLAIVVDAVAYANDKARFDELAASLSSAVTPVQQSESASEMIERLEEAARIARSLRSTS